MSKSGFRSLRRVFSLALVCVLVLSLCPVVFADGETYTISGEVLGLDNNANINVDYFLDDLPVMHSVTTGEDGVYTITNIPRGTKINIGPRSKGGWVIAPGGQTIADVTEDIDGINFMYFATIEDTYTVSGKLEGLSNYAGLCMTYSGAASGSVPIAFNGRYSIPNVPNGGLVLTPPEVTGYNLTGQSNATVENAGVFGVNFEYEIKAYTITGTITGISGNIDVEYTLDGGDKQVTTAIGGGYAITQIPYGTDIVIYPTVQEGYTVSPKKVTINNVTSAQTAQTIVYTPEPAPTLTASGVVTGLGNNENVVVNYQINNGSAQSVTTQAGGVYIINNIPYDAKLTILPSEQEGYTFAPSTLQFGNIQTDLTDKNITYTKKMYTITVAVTGLADLNNVAVDFSVDGTIIQRYTNSEGIATIQAPHGASVEITPEDKTGYSFVAPERAVSITGNVDRSVVYTRNNYSVSGIVSGMSNNAGIELSYKIDDGVAQTVTTQEGGAFVINNIPYESTVIITPPIQGYYSAQSKTVETILDNVTGLAIEYSAEGSSVIYKANGGTGDDITVGYTAGTVVTIGENTFTAPTRGKFKEWNTMPSGIGASYLPGATLEIGSANIILYAIWEITPIGGSTGGGGSGGGKTDKPTTEDANLQVIAVADSGKVLYEANTIETTGEMLTFKALTIPGYTLLGENIQKITIEKGQNNVTFAYRQNVAVALEYKEHIKYINGYPDGTARPDAGITRAEAAAIFFRLASDEQKNVVITSSFSDVENTAWYAQAVGYLAKHGIIKGYDDGTFRPNDSITRAEFTAIISNFDSLEIADISMFRDISSAHWAYHVINSAAIKDWVTGFEDDEFRPEDKITRAQAVTIINRILNRGFEAEDAPTGLPEYRDMLVSHWGYNAIIEASTEHEYTLKGNGVEIWK